MNATTTATAVCSAATNVDAAMPLLFLQKLLTRDGIPGQLTASIRLVCFAPRLHGYIAVYCRRRRPHILLL